MMAGQVELLHLEHDRDFSGSHRMAVATSSTTHAT